MSFSKQLSKQSIMQPIPCWLALALSAMPLTSSADELDTLQFRAAMNKTYDSNLFRRPNNEVAEQITTTTFGVKLDKTYSLQRVIVDLSYVDNKYNENNYLDFAAKNYNASWLWSLTPNFTGTLSSQRTQSLNNFGDFRNTTQNIRTLTDNQFRMQYSPHNVWGLILGFTQTQLANSETFTAITDFDAAGVDYGAIYKFASGSNITFLGHRRRGEFQKRPLDAAIAFDNGYTEYEYEFDLFAQEEGKSKLNAKLGYLEREYDNFVIRNYQSYIGFVNYELLLTGKLKSVVNLSRTIAPFETVNTAYSLSDAVSARLIYDFTSKIQVGVNLLYTERQFDGRERFGSSGREDKEHSYGGFIRWNPSKNIGVSLSSTKSSRNSTISSFDFDDTLSYLNVELKI